MAVLAACWLLTASLWASLIMLAVIVMILIDMVTTLSFSFPFPLIPLPPLVDGCNQLSLMVSQELG